MKSDVHSEDARGFSEGEDVYAISQFINTTFREFKAILMKLKYSNRIKHCENMRASKM